MNHASTTGTLLNCPAGVYHINNSLAMTSALAMDGQGSAAYGSSSGCTIWQDNASVPVFTVTTGSIGGPYLAHMNLRGGTDSIYVAGVSDATVYCIGNLTLDHVTFTYPTVNGIHVGPYGCIQVMNTNNVTMQSGGFTGAGIQIDPLGYYIVGWSSSNDVINGFGHAIYADGKGNNGGWNLSSFGGQGICYEPIVLKGNMSFVVFHSGGAFEHAMNGCGAYFFTCYIKGTTSGPNATTLTVNDGTSVKIGDVVTIQYGAANGSDFQTTITGGSGTSWTVSPAIPSQLTGTNEVTNAKYDEVVIAQGTNGTTPAAIYFDNWYPAYCNNNPIDWSSTRYAFNGPVILSNYWGGTRPVYDPNGYDGVTGNFAGPTRTAKQATLPVLQPSWYERMFDGNLVWPTVTSGNPGSKAGTVFESCGDSVDYLCSGLATGTFGKWWFTPRGAPGPTVLINPNSGSLAVGPNGNWTAHATKTNITIGSGGSWPANEPTANGGNNTIVLVNGTAPSDGTTGQSSFLGESDGEPHWVNPAGTDEKLTPLAGTAPIVVSSGAISCTSATASTFGCVKPDNSTITVSGGVLSASGTTSSAITAAAGQPSNTDGAIQDNTTQKALQVTVNGIQGQSIPTVPSVSVPVGDLVCDSGNDPTIGSRVITGVTVASNAVVTVSNFNGWAMLPGMPVTISGSADTGYNGNYTVVSTGGSNTATISLNSSGLSAFTGAGTSIISQRCSNSSDAGGVYTSFPTNYVAPANSFAAAGKTLSITSLFEIWTSANQANNIANAINYRIGCVG